MATTPALVFMLIALGLMVGSSSGQQQGRLAPPVPPAPPVKLWGYRNEDKNILPADWFTAHPKCMGQQQSPINIDTSQTRFDQSLAPIRVKRSKLVPAGREDTADWQDDDAQEAWDVVNTGISLELIPTNKAFKMQLMPEKETFRLNQMHFHWRGSEHTLDDFRYAAELHLVHQSVEDPERFAVLGFFVELGQEDNAILEPIIQVVKDIQTMDSVVNVESFNLKSIVPPKVTNYYRYSGSLTVPECDEVVNWLVADSPKLSMSERQLVELQSLQDRNGYPILTNSRPLQELFDREVTASFRKGKGKGKSGKGKYGKSRRRNNLRNRRQRN